MTTSGGDEPRGCTAPLDTAMLMDYWLAVLPPGEEERVEEHLMACDVCGDRLRDAIALADALRTLARSESLRVVVSDRFVQHAGEAGRRVRRYTALPGSSVQCTVSADDDLLVAHLAADLAAASRVDLRIYDARGDEQGRMMDIPVRARAGGVTYQESITFAKALQSEDTIVRLVAIDPGGIERLLGDYTFHHTRTILDAGKSQTR
ncbi:MAG: zf-HC2 domain-containing protein [Betaproteobacteria bacterium]